MNDLARKIVVFLSKETRYVDASEIAEYFNVSSKTVYRTIKKINENDHIISSHRGLGYILDNKFQKNAYDSNMDIQHNRTYSIAIYLMFDNSKDKDFRATADKFFLSETALSGEIQKVNSIIKKYSVEIIRKNGLITVFGNERGVRQALNFFLLNNGDISESVSSVENIFPSIKKEDREFILSQIAFIQQKLNVILVEPYTLNFFSHLYILIERIKSSKYSYKKLELNYMDIKVDQFYEIAAIVMNNISKYINLSIDESEITYLARYLHSLRYIHKNDEEKKQNFPIEVEAFAKFIIDQYEFDREIDEQQLFTNLCAHIKPMLSRMKENLLIINPLVEEIKTDYSKEYIRTKEIVDKYTQNKFNTTASDDEVSFLTLYIIKASEERLVKKNVLLMCSTGIGTAQLIKTKLLNAIPNLNVIDVISSYNYKENIEKYRHEVDLVVSTVFIEDTSSIPTVVVSPLLNNADLRKVKSLLDV